MIDHYAAEEIVRIRLLITRAEHEQIRRRINPELSITLYLLREYLACLEADVAGEASYSMGLPAELPDRP